MAYRSYDDRSTDKDISSLTDSELIKGYKSALKEYTDALEDSEHTDVPSYIAKERVYSAEKYIRKLKAEIEKRKLNMKKESNSSKTKKFLENVTLEDSNSSILNNFKCEDISTNVINRYKRQYRNLAHIRITKNTKGYIYTKDNQVVGIINTERKSDGKVWIQALEVFGDNKRKGIGYALLDVAVKQLHARYLSVRKTNTTAINLYKKYGFNILIKKTDDTIYYMYLESAKTKKIMIDEKKSISEGVRSMAKDTQEMQCVGAMLPIPGLNGEPTVGNGVDNSTVLNMLAKDSHKAKTSQYNKNEIDITRNSLNNGDESAPSYDGEKDLEDIVKGRGVRSRAFIIPNDVKKALSDIFEFKEYGPNNLEKNPAQNMLKRRHIKDIQKVKRYEKTLNPEEKKMFDAYKKSYAELLSKNHRDAVTEGTISSFIIKRICPDGKCVRNVLIPEKDMDDARSLLQYELSTPQAQRPFNDAARETLALISTLNNSMDEDLSIVGLCNKLKDIAIDIESATKSPLYLGMSVKETKLHVPAYNKIIVIMADILAQCFTNINRDDFIHDFSASSFVNTDDDTDTEDNTIESKVGCLITELDSLVKYTSDFLSKRSDAEVDSVIKMASANGGSLTISGMELESADDSHLDPASIYLAAMETVLFHDSNYIGHLKAKEFIEESYQCPDSEDLREYMEALSFIENDDDENIKKSSLQDCLDEFNNWTKDIMDSYEKFNGSPYIRRIDATINTLNLKGLDAHTLNKLHIRNYISIINNFEDAQKHNAQLFNNAIGNLDITVDDIKHDIMRYKNIDINEEDEITHDTDLPSIKNRVLQSFKNNVIGSTSDCGILQKDSTNIDVCVLFIKDKYHAIKFLTKLVVDMWVDFTNILIDLNYFDKDYVKRGMEDCITNEATFDNIKAIIPELDEYDVNALDIQRGQLESLNDKLRKLQHKLKVQGDHDYDLTDRIFNVKLKIDDLKKRISMTERLQKQKEVEKEDEDSVKTEKANLDPEIEDVVDTLNKKGYKVKYASAGHTKLRKKEDRGEQDSSGKASKADGVYKDHLYSDARIMFADKYDFGKNAPKYWHWRIVDGCSYLDISPLRYDEKDGTPDEAFAKWKKDYMYNLRNYVDDLPENGQQSKKDDEEETKESLDDYMDDINLFTESMMDEMDENSYDEPSINSLLNEFDSLL